MKVIKIKDRLICELSQCYKVKGVGQMLRNIAIETMQIGSMVYKKDKILN